jgi:hypothetical protein
MKWQTSFSEWIAEWELADMVIFYEKRGNPENHIKETKYDINIGSLKMKSFWANEAFFCMW